MLFSHALLSVDLFSTGQSIAFHSLLILVSFFFRLESSFRSFSRPVLHAAARVVQEMGKSRAAAYFLGYADDESALQFSYSDNLTSVDSDLSEISESKGTCLDILVN